MNYRRFIAMCALLIAVIACVGCDSALPTAPRTEQTWTIGKDRVADPTPVGPAGSWDVTREPRTRPMPMEPTDPTS